jgi:hypothetical protein
MSGTGRKLTANNVRQGTVDNSITDPILCFLENLPGVSHWNIKWNRLKYVWFQGAIRFIGGIGQKVRCRLWCKKHPPGAYDQVLFHAENDSDKFA